MPELSPEYKLLFNAVTDALDAMDEGDDIRAQSILIRAQQNAEERYLCRTDLTP